MNAKAKDPNGTELMQVNTETNTPAAMIQAAVRSGADLEKLHGLLDLQMKWEQNEARKAFNKAMSDFKADPPTITKDKAVSFGVGKTSYRHATLSNVVDKITQALSRHGLSASWRTHQDGQIGVTCRISHVLGHYEETTLTAPADTSGSKNAIQAIGSTVTYLQRYTLLAITGLATEDQDNDGAGAPEVIDQKQLGQILDMLADTDTDEARFIKYLGIEKLEAMPKSMFPKALADLQAKKNKAKAVTA